ncbi:Bug family tripartite tricarboxylate transporter substrate binding protein [Reyranella soli]|uniref:Exported protein n=1 Tax=Reyranella soli TaxID=1230389 RepID=A0A512NL41_9HYPH|nr:tripartite tricarboxylate transporter substrate binding protein [Reyranella soli]GEP59668.1 exported protein [Reyranella soli]
MLTRRAAFAAMLATVGTGAHAQTEGPYPNRPVRFIVPAAPGGPTDVMARMISTGLAVKFGQPAVIVNRAGAGGNIGVVQVAKSPADGYTLLIASTGFVVNPSLFRDPGYDPFKDFLPITELGSSPNVILVHPSSPITSIRQLVDKAKADKEKLDVINPGQGSTPHLTAELLQLKGGIPVENIPYNGAGPAIQALLAKTTTIGITALPPAHAHIKSGALRALAITADKRWFDLPDVPTMEEQGYPGFISETFQGMYAPVGTPDAIVQRVARDTLNVLADASTLEKLRGVGFDVRARGPQGLAERVAREVPMWRDIIVQSRIELQ